ncbi:hypothetical protein DFH27DRAFT_537125 [Peziza echinospora]|nr:hypothetical protein DFH27DRAFT_537125 [Peziza echinospora]
MPNGRPPPQQQQQQQYMNEGNYPAGPGPNRRQDMPIEEGMMGMNLGGGGRGRPPPPNGMGRPPPQQQGQGGMYGGPQQQQQMGGPRRPPPGQGGYPPQMNGQGPPPPRNMGPPQSGSPQQYQPRQGPPPPIRNYGGVPQDNWGGEPQYEHHQQQQQYQPGAQQFANGRPAPQRMNSAAGPPPHQMTPQRSMTLPNRAPEYMSPPQQMPGPSQHSRIPPQREPAGFQAPQRHYGQPMEHNVPPSGYSGPPGPPPALIPDGQYEYHDDLFDSYYDGPDQPQQQQYDGPAEPQYYPAERRGSEGLPRGIGSPAAAGGAAMEGYDPSWELPQPNSNTAFAAQAHRSRSQPNLRGGLRTSGASMHSQHQAVEMPGDMPAVPSPRSGTMPFPAQADLPPVLRVKTPGPGQRPPQPPQLGPAPPFSPPFSPQSGYAGQQQQQQYPPPMPMPQNGMQYTPQRMPSADPYHQQQQPQPQQYPQQALFASPDALPEHPAPVRPGLQHMSTSEALQHQQQQGNSQGPAPVRQYTPRGSMDNRSPQPPPPKGPITAAELAQAVQASKNAPNDPAVQLTLAKKYIEAAAVLADEGGRADAKTTKKNRENFIFDAHKIVKKLANGSHPYADAMFFLAQCHGDGDLGLPVDRERAFSLYHSAAKLNHGPSAYRTAVCCEIGAGTKKDPIKSVQWYKKAASLGDTGAMYKLGIILLKGLLGQPKSTRDALSWLKRAADQADAENPHALHELGLLYERSDTRDQSIIPDAAYACELFTKAAELGYAPSQFRLGHAYEFGVLGCPIDPRRSITWYSRAAAKGEPDSELALSGWYLTGAEGVLEQSDTEAYLWARRAAEKGLMKAEYAVGHLTEAGFGVPPNMEEAKRWYYKAASQGFPKAQERLRDLKKGGPAAAQKSRERLSRSNVKNNEDCVVM